MGLFYDQLGIVTLPDEVKAALAWRPQPVTVCVESGEGARGEWSNPLEDAPIWTPAAQPTASPTPQPTATPWPTLTPVPPLDPGVYRIEVILRLKKVVAALERWIELNERLSKDWALLDDSTWRAAMASSLQEIQETGQALGAVIPAPEEYASIQALMERVGEDSLELSNQYHIAMQTRDPERFRAAGESFQRIKAYLAEAVKMMLDSGWMIDGG